MSQNGTAPDFTHTLQSFTIEGQTFHRQKIPARLWAEKLSEVGKLEDDELKKKAGRQLFAVSTEGLFELCSLAIPSEELEAWQKLWDDGLIEHGEVAALRDWIWEQMTQRPFTSGTPSSDGPGNTTGPSSKAGSSSPVEVQTG